MSFGWNIAPSQIPSRDELAAWYLENPDAPALVINDVPFGVRLKAGGAGPVFCRTTSGTGDAGGSLARTPEQMFSRYQDVFNAGLIAEYYNEVGIARDTAPKMLAAAEFALKEGGQVAIPGLQVGVPNDWSLMLPLVELALKYPSQCWITFHQYFGLAATSGMGGLAPEEFLEAWGPDEALPPPPYFHCGRYRGLFQVLDRLDIRLPHPPLMAITEANTALLGDIDTWQKSQLKTGPCPPGYGWRSSTNAWAKAYPGKSDEQVFSEKMIWLNDNLWRPDGINDVMIYCWDDTRLDLDPCADKSWVKFACRGTSIPNRISAYNASIGSKGNMSMWAWTQIAPTGNYANVRSGADIKGALTRQMTGLEAVQMDGGNYVAATLPTLGPGYWIPIRANETAVTEYVWSGVVQFPKPAAQQQGRIFTDAEIQEMQANLDYVKQVLAGRANTL